MNGQNSKLKLLIRLIGLSGALTHPHFWLGEDETFATRPLETSPSYTGGLKDGDAFHTSDTFPIMWRSE